MQKETLTTLMFGMRNIFKGSIVIANRWMNNWIISMVDKDGQKFEWAFLDHSNPTRDDPLGRLADVIYSLPTVQQAVLVPLLHEAQNSNNRAAKVMDAVRNSIEDIKLEVLALRFDNEATKRERDALIARYESR